eukprot:GHVN01080655.1.p1 GENE.GHVN01080655.1~~GHVN01080655.1.p1  ORF type:complete len:652 (-),score=144.23 GHVN01080655.1:191-2146(-)
MTLEDDSIFSFQLASNNLSEGIATLFQENSLTDFTLTSRDAMPVRCHSLVLAAISPLMKRLLVRGVHQPIIRSESDSVDTSDKLTSASVTTETLDSMALTDASHSLVEAIVRFMYTGDLTCRVSEVPDAIRSADFLEMYTLRDAMAMRASTSPQYRSLSSEHILPLFQAITKHNIITALPAVCDLLSNALISNNASTSNTDSRCNADDEVLLAVVKWTTQKYEERREEGDMMLTNLDFNRCSSQSLRKAVEAFTSLAVTYSQPSELKSLLSIISRLSLATLDSTPSTKRPTPPVGLTVESVESEDATQAKVYGPISLNVIVGTGGEVTLPLEAKRAGWVFLPIQESEWSGVCGVPGGVFALPAAAGVSVCIFKPSCVSSDNDGEVSEVVWRRVELSHVARPKTGGCCVYCRGRVFVFGDIQSIEEGVEVYSVDDDEWSIINPPWISKLSTSFKERNRARLTQLNAQRNRASDVSVLPTEIDVANDIIRNHPITAVCVGDRIALFVDSNFFILDGDTLESVRQIPQSVEGMCAADRFVFAFVSNDFKVFDTRDDQQVHGWQDRRHTRNNNLLKSYNKCDLLYSTGNAIIRVSGKMTEEVYNIRTMKWFITEAFETDWKVKYIVKVLMPCWGYKATKWWPPLMSPINRESQII